MKRLVREAVNALLIVSGILSAGMGLRGFLQSSNFIDGGVTGTSMLLAKITGVPLWVLLPLVNLPFIAVGYRQLGRAFAIRSVIAIAGLSLAVAVVPYPDVTPDLVLTAVFGGFFLGAGIGLAIRGGAVLDGTEIAALLISKQSGMVRVGDVVLGFNVALFLVAMRVLGVDSALYSILTFLAAAKTLDFVLHGIDQYTAVMIMSPQHAAIRERIMNELNRGVTVLHGHGGKSGSEQNILYCVVTRLEIGKVKSIAHGLDSRAFLVLHPLTGVEGGVIRRSLPHETQGLG